VAVRAAATEGAAEVQVRSAPAPLRARAKLAARREAAQGDSRRRGPAASFAAASSARAWSLVAGKRRDRSNKRRVKLWSRRGTEDARWSRAAVCAADDDDDDDDDDNADDSCATEPDACDVSRCFAAVDCCRCCARYSTEARLRAWFMASDRASDAWLRKLNQKARQLMRYVSTQ
jgi:hypothetical protein